jgi:hypothetical protein
VPVNAGLKLAEMYILEYEHISESREKYVEKQLDRKTGTRYAFRLIYLSQTIICLLVYWMVFLSSLWETSNGWSTLFQPANFANMLFIAISTMIVLNGYRF